MVARQTVVVTVSSQLCPGVAASGSGTSTSRASDRAGASGAAHVVSTAGVVRAVNCAGTRPASSVAWKAMGTVGGSRDPGTSPVECTVNESTSGAARTNEESRTSSIDASLVTSYAKVPAE